MQPGQLCPLVRRGGGGLCAGAWERRGAFDAPPTERVVPPRQAEQAAQGGVVALAQGVGMRRRAPTRRRARGDAAGGQRRRRCAQLRGADAPPDGRALRPPRGRRTAPGLRGRSQLVPREQAHTAHVRRRGGGGRGHANRRSIASMHQDEQSVELVELLLDAGADPLVRDSSGRTAARIARQQGRYKAAKLIKMAERKRLQTVTL
mmetsp:Transcript_9143/g.22873  ORF Transcript_9143/g.22873 Transcript_9143/m.22873 type:complete len:205 (+) Transcript_9143:507-1121(+)